VAETNHWAEWIRTRRTGGDAEYERQMLLELAEVRDRVLDNAGLQAGETLLDVGCGNGLIAFGALERGAGEVVFADISRPLLEDCRELAEAAGLTDRCRFLEAPATDLSEVRTGSVDVVTTRSVLIYVKEKERAFEEFHRVLRPGGRISLFEPINRFGMEERRRTWGYVGYDVDGISDLMESVNRVFDSIQPSDDPMIDFDERDLLTVPEQAGFFPITLTYEAKIEPPEARSWETFLHSSGNPKIPTMAEAMDEALTADERDRLVAALRPAVEEGRGVWRMGKAFLWAVRP
jgi:arsenite methyltransferase